MPHVLARGQSIGPTRRQNSNAPGIARPSARDRRGIAPRVAATVTKGLSGRMAQLLLDGDVEGRYEGANESESGYRLTMALAVGASQPGRAWAPADFHQALLYTPTLGGTWARRLRARKGPEYAERKLTAMLTKARSMVASQPPITCRHSAWEAVARIRQAADSMTWNSRDGGDSDLKNLTVRLELCERAGGLDHELSLRRQAELMGCVKQTAADSNRRLRERGWLVLDASGAGTEQGSKWRLALPEAVREGGAGPGHPPAAGPGGGRDGVPVVHTTDTKALGGLIGHDAFHRYGHGTSGARLLVLLDAADGLSAKDLQQATGLHRTTVSRRLRLLVDDGLAVELEGLFYLAQSLAGPVGAVQADEEILAKSAVERGTAGAGERRRRRHQHERVLYRAWRTLGRKLRQWKRACLVPAGVVDPDTGEVLDPQWAGWDVSDPFRPVPLPAWVSQ